MNYGGLDVHKEFVQACWVNQQNEIIREERFETTSTGIQGLCHAAQGSRCVVESSTAVYPVYDALQSAGIPVHAAHPFRVKAIASAKLKTDKVDARMLAQLECANLIPEAHLPNKETREQRELVRQHVSLTDKSTALKCRVKSVLTKNGIPAPQTLFNKRKKLDGLKSLPYVANLVVQQSLDQLEFINHQRERVDALIDNAAAKHPDAVLLNTIPGVGNFSAFLLASAIDGVHRFSGPEHLVSYAGLAPSTRQSGNVTHTGPISKKGNSLMRWVLVQCAWTAIRKSKKFRKRFVKIGRKHGSKCAIVAVARKMLTVAYFMLSRREVYSETA